ncbi:hypothetical protein BU24DRAFT_200698 [Aaosphaeria arxii CBS 175.79]|uniref:Uncharacterized protein n=1 Tax=Aaosphaeria arxii CBS 175.79 TaxID=1450172 RepID=A0A6A5XUI6_9PLEO|nr:uncharacterized protein BU24DRAFT_200698 [Aaosphaeria arxii CBS 175.79]KAF2016371.1 hypothetical protein BU24DRAFT_200698 [Aaosphaeria arxii CBS 175.79]
MMDAHQQFATNGASSSPPRTGPLSRAWPQLFKKRRRQHSPARDVATPLSYSSSERSSISGVSGSPVPPQFKIPIPKHSSSNAPSILSDTASTSTNSTNQADLLAQKSNYEWIAEGRHAEMGLHFSTAMATGVMMRRATHRAAEQARRDRMKSAMVDLAEFIFDGEVTFGSGTSCFVVSRGDGEAKDGVMRDVPTETEADAEGKTAIKGGKKGQNINKARIIEMALEKLKRQEVEIAKLEEQLRDCNCRMDTSE